MAQFIFFTLNKVSYMNICIKAFKIRINFCYIHVFILINAPEALQFKMTLLGRKFSQKYFDVLKPIFVAFGHIFPIKLGEDRFIRKGTFIRINMV